jgi:hypothetical protein
MRERLPHVRRDHSFGDTREKTLKSEAETRVTSINLRRTETKHPSYNSRILISLSTRVKPHFATEQEVKQRRSGWDAPFGEIIKGLGENSDPFLFVNNLKKQNLQ